MTDERESEHEMKIRNDKHRFFNEHSSQLLKDACIHIFAMAALIDDQHVLRLLVVKEISFGKH